MTRDHEAGEGEEAGGAAGADSRPLVVLLHGQPGTPLEWQLVREALPPDLQVLVPARPGYDGDPRAARDWAGNVRWLFRLLDDVAPDRRAVLVAHSWAGGVALEAALAAPDRLAGVVLVDSVGAPGAVNVLDALLALPPLGALVGWVAQRYAPQLARWLETHAAGSLTPEQRALSQRALERYAQLRVWRAWAREQRLMVRDHHSLVARLRPLDVPARVLHGAVDREVPLESAWWLATVLGAPLEVIEGAGHALPLEAPDRVAAAVNVLVGAAS